MHRLFGKPKAKVEAPTLEDTSKGIGGRMTDLDAKINGCDNELRKYKEQLKKANGSAAQQIKKRAMDVLKRKRMYEQQRDQLANQQFNIDQTSFAISTVKDTQTTVAAMAAASKTLKKEAKKIKLSEIEDMQDEMEDMLEDVGEISEILGRSYGMPDGIEEEDLDAELACLEDEWASEEIMTNETEVATSDPTYSLPNQPNQAIVAPNRETAPANPAASAPLTSSTSFI